jgi:hypothetical protein
MQRIRIKLVIALAAAAPLVLVPAAQAANLAPNPGFETDCSGVPCNWSTGGFLPAGMLTRSTTVFHTGTASAELASSGLSDPSLSFSSDCVTVAAGTYNAQFWYLTGSMDNVGNVAFTATPYTGAGCTSAGTNVDISATSVNDGAWHSVTGTMTLPTGTVGMRLSLSLGCNVTCISSNAWFDDVIFQTEPLAAELASFTAVPTAAGVRLRWRTGTNADTLGFYVFRQHAGRRVRVDKRLIPAKGSLSGARYSFLDRRAPRGRLTYRLQAVGSDGSRTWYGPARMVER